MHAEYRPKPVFACISDNTKSSHARGLRFRVHLKLCTLLAYTQLLNLEQFPHVQGATKGIYIHADANLNKVSHVSAAVFSFCEHADINPGPAFACTRDTPRMHYNLY